jgi:purine-binding chemotaxis protein CheW
MKALKKADEPLEAAQAAPEHGQYLTFALGGEMFMIDIRHIKEIIEYGGITPVPMMPEFIRGVINLRGSVVPVIDLAVRFGRPAGAVTRRTCIVIVEIGADEDRHDIGVVVDSVSEVLELPFSEIEPPPAFGAKLRTDFIQGMGKVNGKFMVILNVNNTLSVEDMAVLTHLGAGAGEGAAAAAGG